MKRTTAVILAALVVSLAACKKQNETNVNEEATPAAAPAPAAMPESAATATPATTTPAMDTTKGAMNMGADTSKKMENKMEKKAKK